jgi:GAF domain-containing protein
MEASGQSGQPTPEELQGAVEVSTAAASAVQGAETEAQARERADAAIKAKAEEIHFKLSEEDRHAIVDELIERLDGLGAFDATPAAAAPAPAPEHVAEAAAEIAERQEPEKKSFAERFAGT